MSYHLPECVMRMFGMVLTVAFAAAPVAADDDTAKAARKARIEKYIDVGQPGVFYKDETDIKDGAVTTAYIVGTATISAVLGDAEGLELAKEKAEESAKAEFVKWLGSSVTIRKNNKEEILLTLEGTGGETKEVGKKVERRTKEFDETASSVVRGLKFVGASQISKEKKYVIIYRWEAGVTAAKANGGSDKPKGKDVKEGAKIPDKKVIIDD